MPNFDPNNPQSYFQSGQSTLDPGSMAFLQYFLGGSNSPFGKSPAQQVAGYNNYYTNTFGNQAPGGPTSYYSAPKPDEQRTMQVPMGQQEQASGGNLSMGGLKDQGPNNTPNPDGTTQQPNTNTNTNTNTGGGGNGTLGPFNTALSNNIRASQNWSDPRFNQTYQNYRAQYPSQGAQIGAAMYSNVMPRSYTPPWAMKYEPQRLAGNGYLNGGAMSNYGIGYQGQTTSRQVGNPYPNSNALQGGFQNPQLNNVPLNPSQIYGNANPFLNNQQGGAAWGLQRDMPQQNAMGGMFASPQQARTMMPQSSAYGASAMPQQQQARMMGMQQPQQQYQPQYQPQFAPQQQPQQQYKASGSPISQGLFSGVEISTPDVMPQNMGSAAGAYGNPFAADSQQAANYAQNLFANRGQSNYQTPPIMATNSY